MPSDRPEIRGKVDEDTRDRWKAFMAAHGVEAGPLLEAIGRQLPDPGVRLPGWLAQAVKVARQVEAERKDRRPVD